MPDDMRISYDKLAAMIRDTLASVGVPLPICDVEAFVSNERLAQRVDDLLSYLRDAEPGLNVTYPGQRGWEARDRNLRDGVPIHWEIVEQLKASGVTL
jgi:LDH2 family malate/lactate/ureidoglycolate dehydrogenase